MHGSASKPDSVLYPVAGTERLFAGMLVKARIPTIKDGELTLYERTCVVLGFEGVPKKTEVTGVYLGRLAFAYSKFNRAHGLVIDADEHRLNGTLGMHASSVVRTNRVDLLPIDPFFFGSKIDQVGLISSQDMMEEIGKAYSSDLAEASRGPRARLENSEARQSIEPGMKSVFRQFPLGKIARSMTLLHRAGNDDYERALYQVMLQDMQKTASAHDDFRAAQYAARVEAGEIEQKPEIVRFEYLTRGDIRRRHPHWRDERIDRLVARINKTVRENREAAGFEQPRDPGHITANEIAANEPKIERSTRMNASQQVDATMRSYFSIAKDYTPIMPQNITRGTVLVVKIADIMDPKDGRPAQRPCVVANVYEDKNTGRICGFDFYPRTRLRAHQFDDAYTSSFPNLYQQRIWDGGRIVTQKIARVALDADHFHPITRHIRNINPKLMAELDEKRAQCLADGKEKAPYGVQELPANWILRKFEAPELTTTATAIANRIFTERDRQKPAIISAPLIGDIIMRTVNLGGQLVDKPVLVWGVWNNKVTSLPAAFECMRIGNSLEINRPWSVELEALEDKLAENVNKDALFADATAVDLVHNTERFFEACDTPSVIARLSEETMQALDKARGNALIQCKNRKGSYPEFLRFDWARANEGFGYGFELSMLKTQKFAPDLAVFFNEPGNLRNTQGRANNRTGMPPRRKNDGFRKKTGIAPK